MKTSKFFEFGFATKREINEALDAFNASKIIDGEVNTYADLPASASHNGEIWIVKTTTGVIFVNKKVAGLYISNGTTWTIITPVDVNGYQKLITTATNDNIATTDANGQTKDGGKKIADLEQVINKDATGGYAGLTLFKINFKNVLNTFTSFFTNSNTASRTYTFQDRNGTILDNTDLTAINTSIATKQAIITGGATTIATSDLTINRLLVSSSVGKVAASSVLTTEAGYLSGVTSAIQTQLGAKANIAVASNDITMSSFDTLSGTTFTAVPTVMSLNAKPAWAKRIVFTISFFARVQKTFEISLTQTPPLLISVYRDLIVTSPSNEVDSSEYIGFATYTAGTNSLAIRLQRKEDGGASKSAINGGPTVTAIVSNIQFRD